jgi:hypothetical protein
MSKAFSSSINESINFRLTNALNISDTVPSKLPSKTKGIRKWKTPKIPYNGRRN